MKKGKKLLSFMMSATILAGTLVGGFGKVINANATDVSAPFTYHSSDWAKPEIRGAEESGLIPEILQSADLTQSVTRAEFAAIAVSLYERVTGDTTVYSTNPFADVDNDEYAINKAYQLGITTGMTENMFAPDALISREQLATMLCRVFKKVAISDWSIEKDDEYYLNYDVDGGAFADHDTISKYALSSVYFMTHHNVINGMGNGNFEPNSENGASREQSLIMAKRCMDNLFTRDVMQNAVADVSSWKGAYREYLKENIVYYGQETGDFARGMILCDLNEDKVPELISVSFEDNGTIFHYYKDGKVVAKKLDAYLELLNFDNYFENNRIFSGVYRNKKSGELSFVNSYSSDQHFINQITFDGENVVLKKGNAELLWLEGSDFSECVNSMMQDCEFVENGFYAAYMPRGYYAMYSIEGALAALDDGFVSLEAGVGGKVYNEVTDGKNRYYISNVDLDGRELELIPVATITYEQFTDAMQEDKFVELDGEMHKVVVDGDRTYLYGMPFYEYDFDIPNESHPETVIEGFKRNTPIKVKMSNDVKFASYASADRTEMDVDEYFKNYGINYNNHYYTVAIENGEIVDIILEYNE